MVYTIFFLLTYLHISTANNNPDTTPIVTTPYGKVLGTYSTSYNGKIYSEFLGVPYAHPPVGKFRFREPQPLKKWDGVWTANFTVECAQLSHTVNVGGTFAGQEDCLHSNIYVPKTDFSNNNDLLDVIVTIHGGGLNFGSNMLYAGPKYVMDRNVILVAINYRLGPLGFLSTEDEVVPGNNGMKDQVAAIGWVKNNIKYFGGNPDSITLSGLSAGGASVHFHYMSPLTEGLFKGGISISGTALCPWPLQENALEQARTLAKAVGCDQKSTSDFINCMRQRPVAQICESTRIFRPWLYNPFSVFGVVVEKHGKNRFLPEHPYEILVKGKVRDLPWITTVVSHEGLYPAAEFFGQERHLEKLDTDWENVASHVLHYEYTVKPELKSAIAQKIRAHYLQDRTISMETKDELIQIVSDRLFVVDAEKAARLQAKVNKSPTYFYYFSYDSDSIPSLPEVMSLHFEEKLGISHGDDIALVYSCPKLSRIELSKNDLAMQKVMLDDIWIPFVRFGKPNVNGIHWKPVSNDPKEPLNYLHIASPNEVVMKQSEDLGNRQFWDSLKFQENEYLFPTLSKDEL